MIGNVLKYIRQKRNLKQEALAKQINRKSNALSQYEIGAKQPTFKAKAITRKN